MQINLPHSVELHRADCLDRMKVLPSNSVDLVLSDLPYEVTRCEWDVGIDLRVFWKEVGRVLKPKGTVLAFATQPFSSKLIASNPMWYRHYWIWEKSNATGFQFAKQQPMRAHEEILVFSRGNFASGPHTAANRAYFEPQGVIPLAIPRRKATRKLRYLGDCVIPGRVQEFTNYPRSVLKFASVGNGLHPTQKPVPLLGYLIRSYCPKGGTILDPTMGSGSAGEAAISAACRFIGIEMDAGFFDKALTRLDVDREPVSRTEEETRLSRSRLRTQTQRTAVRHRPSGDTSARCSANTVQPTRSLAQAEPNTAAESA